MPIILQQINNVNTKVPNPTTVVLILTINLKSNRRFSNLFTSLPPLTNRNNRPTLHRTKRLRTHHHNPTNHRPNNHNRSLPNRLNHNRRHIPTHLTHNLLRTRTPIITRRLRSQRSRLQQVTNRMSHNSTSRRVPRATLTRTQHNLQNRRHQPSHSRRHNRQLNRRRTRRNQGPTTRHQPNHLPTNTRRQR